MYVEGVFLELQHIYYEESTDKLVKFTIFWFYELNFENLVTKIAFRACSRRDFTTVVQLISFENKFALFTLWK